MRRKAKRKLQDSRMKRKVWREGFLAKQRERLQNLAKEFPHLDDFQLRKKDYERERDAKFIRDILARRERRLEEKRRAKEERADRLLREIEEKETRQELRRGMKRLALGDKMQVDVLEEAEDGDDDGSEEGDGSWDKEWEEDEEDEGNDNEEGGDNDDGYDIGEAAAFDEGDYNELRHETWNRRVEEPYYDEEEE